MRKLVLLFAVLPCAAFAQEPQCKQLSDVAKVAMEARQKSVPIAALLGNLSVQGDQKKVTETIVEGAYEQPLRYSADSKKQAIGEYASQVYMKCRKAPK